MKKEVKLLPDPQFEISYPRFYSNYIAVSSTPFDFTLRFCDALPMFESPPASTSKTVEVKIPIQAEVVIPKDVFPVLIKAMQDHYNKHVKTYKDQGNEKEE